MKKARSPLRGYLTTLCIWALVDIGLWDPLTKGESISLLEFAARRRLQADTLLSVCRYLNRIHILEIDGERIRLSQKGRKFWSDVYGAYHLFHAYEPLFSSLVGQLKGEVQFGPDVTRHENEVAQGFDELGQQFMFPIMDGLINEAGFNNIIDLGCGEIYLSAFLCRRHPSMKCLGIDNDPEVLEKARRKIKERDFESQIDLLLADMFHIDRIKHDFSPYQVVTAIDLFHGYYRDGEERLVKLFEIFYRVFKNQKLLISEICLPSPRQMKRITYPFVEHELFHDLTRQKSFRPGELESIVKRAGYQIEERWNFNEIAGRICLLLQRHKES